MKTDDPIDKQAAIVSAMTQGRVKWTVAHRDVVIALRDGTFNLTAAEPEVVADVEVALAAICRAAGLTK